MAGARLDVVLDDLEVRRAFQALQQHSGSLEKMLRDIGEHLFITTRERFWNQEGPDGQRWEPLSEVTLARKVHSSLPCTLAELLGVAPKTFVDNVSAGYRWIAEQGCFFRRQLSGYSVDCILVCIITTISLQKGPR